MSENSPFEWEVFKAPMLKRGGIIICSLLLFIYLLQLFIIILIILIIVITISITRLQFSNRVEEREMALLS